MILEDGIVSPQNDASNNNIPTLSLGDDERESMDVQKVYLENLNESNLMNFDEEKSFN